ncbi:MAG: tetratricopeptide repeat protein [Gemmatimonadaceae bacterium]
MSDDVRRLSDALARDPSSTVFLQLGDALRRQGEYELARRVAIRGLERHPHMADAHDLLARISADDGDLQRAFDEWDMVHRLAPNHPGALKGMGFVRFREGELADAERYLAEAAEADAADASIASALAHVRALLAEDDAEGAPTANGAGKPAAAAAPPGEPARERGAPVNPRALFHDVLGDTQQTALLLDASGFVLAGSYLVEDGHDVAQDVGAELSGMSDEAQRAVRHLELGDWTSIVFETEAATVAMAPAPDGGLLVVAAARETPLGLVRRVLGQAGERARRWLAEVA